MFVPVGQTARWRSGGDVPGAVELSAQRTRPDLLGRGERVTVSGRPGWVLEESGRSTLVVQSDDEVSLVFQTPSWDRADLLRLAEATRSVGGPPPPQG